MVRIHPLALASPHQPRSHGVSCHFFTKICGHQTRIHRRQKQLGEMGACRITVEENSAGGKTMYTREGVGGASSRMNDPKCAVFQRQEEKQE
jgi:hypothetical protein